MVSDVHDIEFHGKINTFSINVASFGTRTRFSDVSNIRIMMAGLDLKGGDLVKTSSASYSYRPSAVPEQFVPSTDI
jgi:hypothetical protein